MSGSKSSSQSGLRTFKRDFSENTSGTSSQGSNQSLSQNAKGTRDDPLTLDWPPSPPKETAKLTGMQMRMKAIQEALCGKTSVSATKTAQKPLEESKSANKRVSDASSQLDVDAGAPPVKKRRELPSSWSEDSGPTPRQPTTAINKQHLSGKVTTAPKANGKKVPGVFLSQEQSQILKLVESGMSVFYTGSAGTGKSVLLREIIKTLRKKHAKSADAVAITASTGIAACNIGGVTIHSFAGIGLGLEGAPDLATKIRKNKKASTRWLRTKVLIVDEVSMVDGDLFDKLCEVGSILRKNTAPFGGIQVIVTGDFFQLPPVTKGAASVKFAFEAKHWSRSIQRTFNLTKVFRQTDQEFVDMLNEMRFGRLSLASVNKFKALKREILYNDGLGPTELFPRREDVDRSNSTRLNRLLGEEEMPYRAIDGGTADPQQREKLLSNFMAPQLLVLRVGAQVMLIKNLDETLVNGSMGRVVRFCDPAVYGTESDVDTFTMAKEKPPSNTKAAPKASATKVGTRYPVIEFKVPNGMREVMIVPEAFKVELPNGEIQASRTQFPLILAWAMSIHKSQGQTLERVKVDLGKVFEKGQAYVALSRATSLGGLQVLNFDANKVNAHPKVIQWSQTLETLRFEGEDDEASWTL